jgi:hypothetical protein
VNVAPRNVGSPTCSWSAAVGAHPPSTRARAGALLLALSAASTLAGPVRADDAPSAPSLPADPKAEPTDTDEDTRSDADRLRELEDRIAELEAKERVREARDQEASPLTIGGYVDFGFFAPNGNGGVGWVRDVGNQILPQYSDYAWTFLGDILATSINSRGEAADLGDGPGLARFDSVNSDGGTGFLVNEVSLRVEYALTPRVVVRSEVDFVPRTGEEDFSIGDFVDIDLAEMEWIFGDDGHTSVFVGKMLPVFGIEYKEKRSDQRFGITPSLIHRYTSGNQLGLKVRTKLLDGWLILAAAVTNNSSSTEQFHFSGEVDKNWGKTLNGRVALHVPLGELIPAISGDFLEVGGSGEWGPQDRATDVDGQIWFAGVDLTYSSAYFTLKGQWMRGFAPGRAVERVWALDLSDSGYVELQSMLTPWLGLMVRGDLRQAVVTLARDRVYVTDSFRVTGGARVVFNSHIAAKAEYLHNGEFGDVPEFDNDVFVSALVLSY